MIGTIFLIFFIICFLILPIILTFLNLFNLFAKRKIKPNVVDILIMIFGPVLMAFLFSSWAPKDYTLPILLHSTELQWHTPLAYWHMPTIIVLSILGLVGYIVIRKCQLKLPPLIIVLCISCIFIGNLIGGVWIMQLSSDFFKRGVFIPFEALYLCLFPLNYTLCSISIIRKVINDYVDKEAKSNFTNPFLNKCDKLLQHSRNWSFFAIIMTVPILGIALLVLVLFGQQPDAAVKAFTETSDWFFSQKVSPPPIEYEGHYLCTVSLRGHPELVKPLRYGIRHNHKIIVNRQLCVANAFEQLIQERVPKIHRFIRNTYDKYGLPISRYIKSPVSADIVYILMKPLEWFFVFVLYLLDEKPENRISIQYTPKRSL